MRVLKMAVILSTLVGAAACGRDAKPADQHQQQLTWLDSLMTQPAQPVATATPLELNQAAVPQAAVPQAQAPVAENTTSASTTHRSTSTTHHTARRHRSYSSGTYASTAGTYQRRSYTVKHTRRDAAIGAAGGAVIGAVAGGSHHRVRGAILGGVLGGVAGAVIGNNVDKHRIQF